MKRVSLRVVTGLVLTAILLTALAAYFAWASTPSTSIWIVPGIYPGAPDYTIWRDGSNYYAKDENGYIEYSGTNATAVIEGCLGNNRAIELAPATYIITKHDGIQIWNCHNLTIYCQSQAILKKQEQTSCYVGQILEIMRTSLHVTLIGLTFDQDRDNANHELNPSFGEQWNVRVGNGSGHILFERCRFINGEQSTFTTGNGEGQYTLRDCIFNHAGEHIVYLSGAFGECPEIRFYNCKFYNWAEQVRGWVNVGPPYVTFTDCYFEPDTDHTGFNSSGYTVVVGEARNHTTFEGCTFMNPYNGVYAKGNNTRWINCRFINTYLADGAGGSYGAMNIPGNNTFVSGCDFINWTYRIIYSPATWDLTLQGCFFSGGVSSSTVVLGNRTSIIGCIWQADNTNGNYGINDASGDGIIMGCHICNDTLTFNFPSEFTESDDNIYDR